MTKLIQMTLAMLALLCAVMTTPANAAPFTKPGTGKSASLSQAYTWYDGNSVQQVWLNPDLLAEFNPSSGGARAVKNVSPGATPLTTKRAQAGVRLWRLNNIGNATVRALTLAHPRGAYSPVFHDSSSVSGRMRALPGNVIVYLNPQWDAATVNNWIAIRKLEIVRKLGIGANVYVIKTAPGLDALDIANSLYLSGEVVASSPSWWEEMATR
jgi:hypothetical protein